jgi:hypothetical protein
VLRVSCLVLLMMLTNCVIFLERLCFGGGGHEASFLCEADQGVVVVCCCDTLRQHMVVCCADLLICNMCSKSGLGVIMLWCALLWRVALVGEQWRACCII